MKRKKKTLDEVEKEKGCTGKMAQMWTLFFLRSGPQMELLVVQMRLQMFVPRVRVPGIKW